MILMVGLAKKQSSSLFPLCLHKMFRFQQVFFKKIFFFFNLTNSIQIKVIFYHMEHFV